MVDFNAAGPAISGRPLKASRRLAIAAGLAALATPAVVRGATEPTLKIGGLYDLSGPFFFSGRQFSRMLRFAVDEVNAAGGLLGRQVEIVGPDAQTNMQLYSSLTQQLAMRDKVSAVFGGIASSAREVMRPILHRARIPYFWSVNYEGGVCDRNVFSNGTTPDQTMQKLLPYTTAKWGKKIYVLAADFVFGQTCALWAAKVAKDIGAEIVATDFFPLDATNFGVTIAKIQAAKPDMILSIIVGANNLSFYRQWAAAGMKDQIPIASTSFGGGGTEPTLLSPVESNGIVTSFGYYPAIDTPANKAFVQKVYGALGPPPEGAVLTEASVSTYEAFQMWVAAVKATNTTETAQVVQWLEGNRTFDLPSGANTIDPATHHNTRPVYIAALQDRAWKIEQAYPAQPPSALGAKCDLIKNPDETRQLTLVGP